MEEETPFNHLMSVDIGGLSEGTLATNMLEMPQTQLIQANWAEHKQVNK